MDIADLILLFLAIGVIAFLYSCVGHAGASGYIAVMTLFGFVTTTIRPTALFFLVNSIAGLAGFVSARQSIPALAVILSAAAIIGGAIGSHLGSRKFPVRTISILLATVLVIAGCKLIFTR